MDKRRLHHYWRYIRPLKSYYFLVLAIAFLVIGVYGLRQNNVRSIELRDELVRVDKENGDVEAALRNLREHIYAHMNSDLSSGEGGIRQPVQLTHTYQRLVDQEAQRVSEQNERIYNDAQNVCEQKFPAGFFGASRLDCIEEYVQSNGVSAQPIVDDFYKFDFVSPRWSPDLAGLSLLASVLFAVLFVFQFMVERWVKYNL